MSDTQHICTEAPYSANFVLYNADGLRVQFTVRGDGLDGHWIRLRDCIQHLTSQGFTVAEAGLEPGEQTETIVGWVLGETRKDEPCVYLFNRQFKFRVATVYAERISELPIEVANNQQRWPGAAPDKETAQHKRYWRDCSFDIVLEPSGKTSESGRPLLRYKQVKGGTSPAATTAAPPSGKPQAGRGSDGWDEALYRNTQKILQGVRDINGPVTIESGETLTPLDQLSRYQQWAEQRQDRLTALRGKAGTMYDLVAETIAKRLDELEADAFVPEDLAGEGEGEDDIPF